MGPIGMKQGIPDLLGLDAIVLTAASISPFIGRRVVEETIAL